MKNTVVTESPWNQKKYIWFGAIYIGVILAGSFFIGLSYFLSRFDINIYIIYILSLSISSIALFLIIRTYYRILMKSQTWTFDGMILTSPKLQVSIEMKDVKKAYIGIDRPKSKFLRQGSSIAKSYYPEVPNYYDNALVLMLSKNRILSLSLYHLKNGAIIMEEVKDAVHDKIDVEGPCSIKILEKGFSSNKIIKLKE